MTYVFFGLIAALTIMSAVVIAQFINAAIEIIFDDERED